MFKTDSLRTEPKLILYGQLFTLLKIAFVPAAFSLLITDNCSLIIYCITVLFFLKQFRQALIDRGSTEHYTELCYGVDVTLISF